MSAHRSPRRRLLAGALSLPNAVSLLRIPLLAAFFITESAPARAAIIVAAALSDYVDGWLARRLQRASPAGELLDPATDKLFVVGALVAFASDRLLETWALFLVLARDILTVGAFLIALPLRLHVHFRARFSGKVVTTLQLAVVLVLTLAPAYTTPIVLATGAATLWAVIDYAAYFVRSLRGARAAG